MSPVNRTTPPTPVRVPLRGVLTVALVGVLVGAYACSDVVQDVTPQPEDYAAIAEQYCVDHPELPCGHVYECAQGSDNDLGHVEICVVQYNNYADLTSAEAMYGACMPTPRHEGLCWWCCGSGCTQGCNSFDGCFCGSTGSGSGTP